MAFLNSGYRVFGLARNLRALKQISAQVNQPTNYHPIEFDITKPESFAKIISEIVTLAGPQSVYALVNNAGYLEPGAIEDITMDALRLQFETNFFGLVGFTKQILPIMLQNRAGRIVNVSSLAGLISLPLIGAYSATKHALEAVSDALRAELWDMGIKVVNINPGIVETNIHNIIRTKASVLKNSRFTSGYRNYLEKTPKGVAPEVAAKVILQAVSSPHPRARYLVGSAREKIAVRLSPLIPDALFYPIVSSRIRK